MYKRDEETGLLEKQFILPISGSYPKDLDVFPDGKHLAVVNHESNSITTFTIDYEKKLLVMKGKPMKVETPNSIIFSKFSLNVNPKGNFLNKKEVQIMESGPCPGKTKQNQNRNKIE